MKVYIGPYPNRCLCRIHTRYMDKKYGIINWPTEQSRFENFLEKLEDAIQIAYNCTINLFLDRRVQKEQIHIDRWDTWSMDHTLAPIILPMLIQLRATTHGSPNVDPEDVPENLRVSSQDYHRYKRVGETDDNYHKRWDWVLGEMIYAFDCKANKDDVYMRFDLDDKEGMQKEQERISNGFRLFGKYYEGLWD